MYGLLLRSQIKFDNISICIICEMLEVQTIKVDTQHTSFLTSVQNFVLLCIFCSVIPEDEEVKLRIRSFQAFPLIAQEIFLFSIYQPVRSVIEGHKCCF